MSVLVDHCVPGKFKTLLESWDCTASLLKEHIKSDSSDADVLALAQHLDAVLLTVDMDFANILNYPPQNYQGIIVKRYQIEDEIVLSDTLKKVIEDCTAISCVVCWLWYSLIVIVFGVGFKAAFNAMIVSSGRQPLPLARKFCGQNRAIGRVQDFQEK